MNQEMPGRRKSRRGAKSPLYDILYPAVYVIRVFGLAPYEFDKDGRLQPSSFNCVYSLFWALLNSYIVVATLMRFAGLNEDKPVLGYTDSGKVIFYFTFVSRWLKTHIGPGCIKRSAITIVFSRW